MNVTWILRIMIERKKSPKKEKGEKGKQEVF